MIYMGIYYKKMSFAETFWGQNEFKTSYKFVRTTFAMNWKQNVSDSPMKVMEEVELLTTLHVIYLGTLV